MDLLRQGCEEAVAELAIANPRAVRPLIGRLWDPEPQIRQHAAGALGRSAAAHPALGQEVVRRLMWALNEEAGINGLYGIAALGEIGYRCPDMIAPFVPSMVLMARDEGIRLELLRALSRIAEADGRPVREHLDRLEGLVDETREDEQRAFRQLVATTKGRDRERD
jgi:HEAT repeat protein